MDWFWLAVGFLIGVVIVSAVQAWRFRRRGEQL
jgi:hypothetical protein